eukprot:3982286-Prymnesium_polylepis.1
MDAVVGGSAPHCAEHGEWIARTGSGRVGTLIRDVFDRCGRAAGNAAIDEPTGLGSVPAHPCDACVSQAQTLCALGACHTCWMRICARISCRPRGVVSAQCCPKRSVSGRTADDPPAEHERATLNGDVGGGCWAD